MATFKTISSADIKTTKTVLNQLIDFVEEDVSGSASRKSYQVFVTSSGGNAITSSLFQTVFDQNFSLQTANELFDVTYGVFSGSASVSSASTGIDTNGKILFTSQSVMMREKINIYRQFAQTLLGNADNRFRAPFSSTSTSDNIDNALFLCFKRLFVRDGIKRETFAMRFFQSSSNPAPDFPVNFDNIYGQTAAHPSSGSVIFTDVGAASSIERSQFGGDVGNIVLSSDTTQTVGLMFYQKGIAILDLERALNKNQIMSGTISSVGATSTTTHSASFVPHFVNSASMDDIIRHVATERFGTGSNTFLTFQNNTKINSTLIFCRATADEFNYSSNPTYTDSEGRILVIDESQQGEEKSFSFVSTVGLYDANEELLATAKLSRPVEKNDEKDLTFRVRLDF
tara:strand:+ start:4521 stop:5717 length:1197 start_codon:yes stop_codon:yes gene_type:complete